MSSPALEARLPADDFDWVVPEELGLLFPVVGTGFTEALGAHAAKPSKSATGEILATIEIHLARPTAKV